jgi:thymidylate synthase
MLNIQHIDARDLPDAWFQTLFKILEEGSVFKIDRGSFAGQKRLEFDWITVRIKDPGHRPLLPQIEEHFSIPNPVADDYLDEYISYLMTGEVAEGESYTYGQRMTKALLEYPTHLMHYKSDHWKDIVIQEDEVYQNKKIINRLHEGKVTGWNPSFLNQIELLIWTYKNKGYRNNQMILQVAEPTDMLLQDPPCLRHIDTRIQDGKLHFYPYFRSWDLWGGLPANLGGIQLLKEYVAGEIGVEDGEIIASSKGLHIYDYSFDLAKCLRMRDDMKLKQGD